MPESTDKMLIFFEEINSFSYGTARNYTLRDNTMVCFFRIDKGLDSSKFIDVSKTIFDYTLYVNAAATAHKNIDAIFDKYFSKSASIATTTGLYQSPELINMYKKEILLYLNDLYYLEYKINSIITEKPAKTILFIPAQGAEIHADGLSPLSKRIQVLSLPNIQIEIKDWYNTLREYLLFFYPFYILIKKIGVFPFRKKPKKTFQLGINANLPGILSDNYHYISYLVDRTNLSDNKEIIFIDERYNKTIPEEFKKYGAKYIDFTHGRRVIFSNAFCWKLIRHFIPAWFICTIQCLREDRHIVKQTRIILTDYVRWNLLMDNFNIKNHVAVLLPDTISKNLILAQHGCKTWYIYPDNSTTEYSTGWDESIPVSTFFTFVMADAAIVYNDKIRRFLGYHRNNIREYIPVGIFASQRVREIREGTVQSALTKLLIKRKFPRVRIGIFDIAAADFAVIKIKDGIQFGKDMLQLLTEFPEVGLILKEKKFRGIVPELTPVYEELGKHPRCITVNKGDSIFASDVIAASDLVISAAYTSTTAEALGAQTKAIYYDVVGKDIGDNFYFNKFPNLVAHHYSYLKQFVEYWLYHVTPEEFESYLNTHIKGELDPYLDGHAADRVKKLLGVSK